METQPSTQLATKLAFSSSRELYKMVETSPRCLEMVGIGFLTGGFLYFVSKISGLSVDVYGLLQ
jgi:hypothetical protein